MFISETWAASYNHSLCFFQWDRSGCATPYLSSICCSFSSHWSLFFCISSSFRTNYPLVLFSFHRSLFPNHFLFFHSPFLLIIPPCPSPQRPPLHFLTVALCSSAGRQGNGVLHGSAEARVSAVGVAESGSVDVELGVLGGEGWRGQGVGGVSEGRRLPQTAAAAGRLVHGDLIILETGSEGLDFQNTTEKARRSEGFKNHSHFWERGFLICLLFSFSSPFFFFFYNLNV